MRIVASPTHLESLDNPTDTPYKLPLWRFEPMTKEGPVACELLETGAYWRVFLDRPEGNILDGEMFEALTAIFREAGESKDLKVLCIEGRGAHFSFGSSIPEHMPEHAENMLRGFHQMLQTMLDGTYVVLAALVHESVRDTHGTFWRPNLLPDDRLGFRLAQLSHQVQYIAPDHRLPLLRFVAARTKAVSERALVPEEKILDGALSSIP